MVDHTIFDSAAEGLQRPARSSLAAMGRGLRGRCPACGEGRILRSYLSVNDSCHVCGEELHHHRADDFPPYITIFVVGHILGALMFAVDDCWPNLPIVVHYVTWPILCVVLSLWLLPIFKGGLIAYQWALRMHGFETAHVTPKFEPVRAQRAAVRRSAA